jgi:hypothetical protein
MTMLQSLPSPSPYNIRGANRRFNDPGLDPSRLNPKSRRICRIYSSEILPRNEPFFTYLPHQKPQNYCEGEVEIDILTVFSAASCFSLSLVISYTLP